MECDERKDKIIREALKVFKLVSSRKESQFASDMECERMAKMIGEYNERCGKRD